MASRTAPIDIATQHASSRGIQTSNLTSALQATSGNESRPSTAMAINGSGYGHRDSLTGGIGAGSHSGAQPISMNSSNLDRPRRESLAGSMVTGMSWGGASVGSWIRDDIIMQGTSPFGAYQSPSFHSSSYMPKLEASFMRDFSCCNLTLPTLHDLLEHYEENHAQQVPPSLQRHVSSQVPPPDPKAAIAAGAAAAVQDPDRAQQQQKPSYSHNPSQGTVTPQRSSTPLQSQRTPQQAQQSIQGGGFITGPASSTQDDDAVGDMEMDDFAPSSTNMQQAQYPLQDQPRMMQRNQFGQPVASRVPPLDLNTLNMSGPMQQHQGLRHSTPTTPVSAGRSGSLYQNNPTVSSVNTPTLSTHPGAHPLQQQMFTPESSAPGTPRDFDPDLIGNMAGMNVGNNAQYMANPDTNLFGNPYGYSNGNEMLDLCIDQPAKRLFTADGRYNAAWEQPQPQPQPPATPSGQPPSQLPDSQYSENSELAKAIRHAQKQAGVPDPSADGTPKPFHCPVIGCEKAYKNQNGLKYHKAHGHNQQKLHANSNGTYSIVDPDTLVPYAGTIGMEKSKPFRCQTCGRRYKNLNGLKYHKAHSQQCDPEIESPHPFPVKTDGTDASASQQSSQRSGDGDDEMNMS